VSIRILELLKPGYSKNAYEAKRAWLEEDLSKPSPPLCGCIIMFLAIDERKMENGVGIASGGELHESKAFCE